MIQLLTTKYIHPHKIIQPQKPAPTEVQILEVNALLANWFTWSKPLQAAIATVFLATQP